MSGYAFSVWIHVIAAATWVGSMVFFAAVVVPVLRRPDVRANAPELLRLLGPRFSALGWIALGLLTVTGTLNLYYRGLDLATLAQASFWAQGFGAALGRKLVLVSLVVIATGAHNVLADKRLVAEMEHSPTSPAAIRARRNASWVGRFVLLASLAILYYATALVRGFG